MVTKKKKSESSGQEESTAAGVPVATEAITTFREYRDRGLAQIEREYLHRLIAEAGGSYKKANRISGLARTRLYELLKKHGLSLK